MGFEFIEIDILTRFLMGFKYISIYSEIGLDLKMVTQLSTQRLQSQIR